MNRCLQRPAQSSSTFDQSPVSVTCGRRCDGFVSHCSLVGCDGWCACLYVFLLLLLLLLFVVCLFVVVVVCVCPEDDAPARFELVGFITHLGPSIQVGMSAAVERPIPSNGHLMVVLCTGHYVAHLKRGDKWVCFNDQKVCEEAA